MPKKQPNQFISRQELNEALDKQTRVIENILGRQTDTILTAVDCKIFKLEGKLIESETRINAKINKLITTIDKFLKRLTDMEDEFNIMKLDINRIKKVIKEKLGVNLS